jgi:hypothetical protein
MLRSRAVSKTGLIAVALAFFGVASVYANCTVDRPGLIESAETLKVNIEKLDEALHEASAEAKVIQIIHHFEEGIMEFVEDLRNGEKCQAAIVTFQHFHEDIMLIYNELNTRPQLFYQKPVLSSWNRMLPSYVRFQNRLYW